MKPTTYAVVDIETTGTDPKTDRIIQFGCVLVENGEIVSRFATDINPNQMITKQIQSLTGISNGRVKKAPYFEDVAFTIYNLLSGTIFVAHNIYFDYKFLNAELKRCGTPELTIPGIDTVELAQIFLPTETSFRLKYLSDSLGLVHENPHQADSDADVTAQLLLKIQNKMRSLPIVTMEKIADLSNLTGMDTSIFIQRTLQEMKGNPQPLIDDIEIIDGIALQKKELTLYAEDYYNEKKYPKSSKAKKKIFGEKLELRKEQNQLMNQVYRHYTEDEDKNLVIEAATGMGKTIGYLLPLSYLATPDNPAVISTASIVLQQQILNKDIPLLNQVLPHPIQGTLVKSHRHYLDLQRFRATLGRPVKQKQYALYQMAVLVWLTETTTGDFDELQMTNLKHIFWEEVGHRGVEYLAKSQPFYQEDFLIHLQRKMAESNFLIINHAYLAQESLRASFQLPESRYLLIDEAHHLGDSLEKANQHRFSSIGFQRYVQQLNGEGQLFEALTENFKGSELAHPFRLFYETLTEIVEDHLDFFKELLKLIPPSTSRYPEEVVVDKELFENLSDFGFEKLQQLLVLYRDLAVLQTEIKRQLELTLENWQLAERSLYGSLFSLFENLDSQYQLFENWTQNWQGRYVHWLIPDKSQHGATLFIHDYEAAIFKDTRWYERYQKIVYLGGTMKVGKDRYYFPKRWGLGETKVKIMKNPYDFEKQVRLFVPEEGLMANQADHFQFASYLTETLLKVAESEKRRILVLFTSHDLLRQVYFKVQPVLLDQGREIMAQGIGGSREKLLKRFFLSEDGILLGADSYWEGIDLPGDTLQLLLVTRLPFENPQRPLVKARNAYLEGQGMNPFYQEAVPKTALKLRQALGRLIRSQEDKGVMIVLDRRLVAASYGRRMIKSFPEQLAVEERSLERILKETHRFLTKKQEEIDELKE